jgi:hypothetical protein
VTASTGLTSSSGLAATGQGLGWLDGPSDAVLAARAAAASLRMIAGSGSTVGITLDGRAVPGNSSECETFRFGFAPAGFVTRRQLRAKGLRPGGGQPRHRVAWRHGQSLRWAWLYDESVAKPKFAMTPAKTAALAKAMRARRTCPACGRDVRYCIPTSLGVCIDCDDDQRN